MNRNFYGVGLDAAVGSETIMKFCTPEEAAASAVERGIGFIVEYQYRDGKPVKRTILGWNIRILSYKEAIKQYSGDKNKMNIIALSHPSTVFIVSLLGREKDEVIFPFCVEALRVVKLGSLL